MRKFVIMPDLYDDYGLYGGYRGSPVSSFSLNHPYVRIMLELPPEATGFYCPSHYVKINHQLLEELNGRGIPIVYDALDGISPDTVVLSSPLVKVPNYATPQAQSKFAEIKRLGAKVLFFIESTDDTAWAPSANEFFLYSSEAMMFLAMSGGRFSLDAQGTPEVGLMPDGGQAGAVGPLRANDIPGNEEDRSVLKAKLAEIMKTDFHAKLPLVLHFLSFNTVLADLDRGLSRLGDKVNLLIKGIHWHERLEDLKSKAKGRYVFFFNQHSHYHNWLLRYASDFIMPACFSGAITTSLMMGLRVIPIYTQHTYPWLSSYLQKKPLSFTTMMRTGIATIPLKIMDYLPPICVNATDMLHDRIFDYEYWKKYDQQLPQIQRAVFGRYLLGEAAVQRAKGFVFRLLQFGGFLPPYVNAKDLVSVPHPLNADNVIPPL